MPDVLSRPLSTIELTVLGIVSKQGPCKAYAVMREFASSSSSYYRSGAGTIYPSVERLLKGGYLEFHDPASKTYVLGKRGKDALHEWLTGPVSDHDLQHSVDLVRLRTYFLQNASPEERRALLSDARHRLAQHVDTLRQDAEAYRAAGDQFSALAVEGSIMETEARVRWLDSVLDRLVSA